MVGSLSMKVSFCHFHFKTIWKKKVSFIAIRQGQKLGLLEIAKGCATQSKRFFSFLILIKYIMWMFCKNLLSFYCLTIAITKSYPNKLGRLYGHDTIWPKKKKSNFKEYYLVWDLWFFLTYFFRWHLIWVFFLFSKKIKNKSKYACLKFRK